MKNFLTVSAFICFNILLLVGVLLITTPSFSYYMTKGIVEKDVYEMIDSFVAGTPHADMVLDSMPETGTTVMTITTDSSKFLEDMVEEGIMDYFSMLDGNVTVVFEYGGDIGTAVMTITQVKQD